MQRDNVYCYYTARRAVARAAIHIGIENMTPEALDAMADVLLAYLSRIGHTLAVSVEASGRSSAHVHVLDAIRAIECCTEAAVQRVYFESSSDGMTIQQESNGITGGIISNNISSSNNNDTNNSNNNGSTTENGANHNTVDIAEAMSWKGLASFCFGPKWYTLPNQQQHESDQQQQELIADQQVESTIPGGGKQGPTSSNNASALLQVWNAPHPDEVPDFPIAPPETANPHPLSNILVDTLHNERIPGESASSSSSKKTDGMDTDEKNTTEAERLLHEAQSQIGEIPDSVFTNNKQWGDMSNNNTHDSKNSSSNSKTPPPDATKQPAVENGKAKADEPPTKKVKISETASSITATATDQGNDQSIIEEMRRPGYLPMHFPPLPIPNNDHVRTVMDADISNAAESDATKILNSTDTAVATATATKSSTTTSDTARPFDTDTNVRSALVQLGRNVYWGSTLFAARQDNDDDDENGAIENDKNVNRNYAQLLVPSGRTSSSANNSSQPQIVPLGRASGSRVSRILEGSMEE